MRIAFARQNGLENGLSGHPADIAQYIGQLDIHLREHLLYPLDVPDGCPYEIVALPPDGNDTRRARKQLGKRSMRRRSRVRVEARGWIEVGAVVSCSILAWKRRSAELDLDCSK